jgi:hypothetical protein
MKTKKTSILKSLPLTFLVMLGLACSNDDNGGYGGPIDDTPMATATTRTYLLGSVAVPDISGTATFTKFTDNSITVALELQNTPAGGQHPAHIHFNTAAEGGGIAITLGTVNGDTGTSSINFKTLDDGSAITYEELLDFDGYINVHLSAEELGTIVAQGDIGQNELTQTTKTYVLNSVAVPDIDGTATFTKRVNGEALAIIALNNTPEGGIHPGHIHFNTAAEGGDIAFTFNPVNGDTGLSVTNVASLDDETPFLYDDLLEFDGYINVHLSAEALGTIVAQGDIGQNELTGTSKVYVLNPVAVPEIEGTATFFERVNGEALATIQLVNTPPGGSHPGHIHMNDAATGGGIVFTFNPVDGDTGLSNTNVAALDDATPFGYDEVLAYNGYINIHLSADNLATLVAQGDIGSNIDPSAAETIKYDVSNIGSTSYVFNGNGLTDADNPDLTLVRGNTYTFTVNASGHPFFIKTVQGNSNANAYANGVTNNGEQNGTITFVVPMDAPDILYYNCQFHSAMTGTFNITG